MLQNMKIIIVGGSIAGLFTGIVLSNLSCVESIIILEKSQENQQKDQGAGIRLDKEVINSVTKYIGVQPEDYCVQTRFIKQFDENGNVVMSHEGMMWACSWASLFRVLKGKFSQQGQKNRYRNGCTVVNVLDTNETVQVHLTNETGQRETAEADLVVGADGISSTIRQLLVPECARIYAGYTVLRGLVPPSELPSDVLDLFNDISTNCFTHVSQTLSYWVPGSDAPSDDQHTDKRLNWAWYRTYSQNELGDIMTDSSGSTRAFTVPQGALREEVAEGIRAAAQKELPKMFADVVENTKQPFLQAITDSMASNNVFFNGKVILIGDAFAGQRPHVAAACTQCTFHTLVLKSYLEGGISLDQMSQQAQEFSKILVNAGKELGSYIQSTTLVPAEKTRNFVTAWRAAQGELTRRYVDIKG